MLRLGAISHSGWKMLKISRDQNDIHRYDDIIDLDRPVIEGEREMSMIDRAGQFSPFAALTGYGELIEEAQEEFDRSDDR